MSAPKVKFKRSSVPGKHPSADQLPLGEIALNTHDGIVYISKSEDSGITTSIVNVSGLKILDENILVGYANTIKFTGLGVVASVVNNVGIVSIVSDITGTERSTTTFTSTAGQTTFSLPSNYTVGYADVYLNGVKLSETQYTATDGTNVVLDIGASNGDVVEIVYFSDILIRSGIASYASFSGIATYASFSGIASGLTGTPNINAGIITASTFFGNGSNLTNIVSGVGLQTAGGLIGIGATILDFRGPGIESITVSSGIGTIVIVGAGIGTTDGVTTRGVYTYTATGGQTTFLASYVQDYLDVFLNGVKLSKNQYTATDGSSFVLNTGASEGDVIEAIGFTNINIVGGELWRLNTVGIHTLINVGIGTTNPVEKLTVVGVVSATSFYGDGSKLTNIVSGVGLQTAGGLIGIGATILDFRGPGISNISVSSGIATIIIVGGGSIGGIGSTGTTQRNTTSDVATAGQTYFLATYVPGYLDVFLNGVKLSVSQYTATDGSSFTLNTPASEGDIIETISFIAISLGGGGGSSQWVTTDVGIHTLSNIGIGTTNPTSKLHVIGDVRVSGIISASSYYGDGSNLTGINVNRFLTVTSRVGIVSITTFVGIVTVFGRLSNTNVLL